MDFTRWQIVYHNFKEHGVAQPVEGKNSMSTNWKPDFSGDFLVLAYIDQRTAVDLAGWVGSGGYVILLELFIIIQEMPLVTNLGRSFITQHCQLRRRCCQDDVSLIFLMARFSCMCTSRSCLWWIHTVAIFNSGVN